MTNTSRVLIFTTASIFVCISYFLQTMPAATAHYMDQTLHIDSGELVTISSLFFLIYGLMQVPSGIIVDRFGVKILLPIGILLTLIGVILYWFGTNSYYLGISRFLEGFGTSISYVIAIFIAARFFPNKVFPILMGFIEIVAMVGDIIATEWYNQYIDIFGWNIANLTLAIVCGCLLLFSLIYVFLDSSSNDSEQAKPLVQLLKEILVLLKNRAFIYVLIYGFFTWLTIQTFAGYWGRDYFMVMHDYTELESLNLMTLYWLGLLLGCIGIGFIATRFGCYYLIITLLAALGAIVQAVMSIPVLFDYYSLVVVALLTGIATSGIVIAFSIIGQIVEPHIRGTAIGFFNFAMIFGSLAGQLLFNFILQHFNIGEYMAIHINGQYYSALLIFPLSAIISFLSIVLLINNIHKSTR